MKLLVSRELVAAVARSWARQYPAGKDGINAKLDALDPATATADEVARIIGNKSWSYFTCDECHQYVEQAVSFSEEYSERTTTLCPSCLRAASALASVRLP